MKIDHRRRNKNRYPYSNLSSTGGPSSCSFPLVPFIFAGAPIPGGTWRDVSIARPVPLTSRAQPVPHGLRGPEAGAELVVSQHWGRCLVPPATQRNLKIGDPFWVLLFFFP